MSAGSAKSRRRPRASSPMPARPPPRSDSASPRPLPFTPPVSWARASVDSDRLAAMAHGWWRISSELGERGGRVLLYRLGPERSTDRVLVAWTRSSEGAADQPWHLLASLPARWTAPAFPLKAAD